MLNRKKKQAKKNKKAKQVKLDILLRSAMARKLQVAWRRYLSQKTEYQSNLEEMAVVDYRYRTEKMFDFSQLEEDHLMSSLTRLNSKDTASKGPSSQCARLSKQALSKLDSYSIEEKLNFS